ncbi:MAG: hypothetical protein ACRCZF_28455, partial [Gemmataceae bacterium]
MPNLAQQLRQWQLREGTFRTLEQLARWLFIVATGLFLACFIDWWIDRTRDTPFLVRLLLTTVQVGIAIAVGIYFLRQSRYPNIDSLASRAEARFPQFGHRLVTALQLNRPGAKTAGMSAELIAQVTREAEEMTAKQSLVQLADRNPVKLAGQWFAPVAIVLTIALLLAPKLTTALLARQALLPIDIPRNVEMENLTPELWPSGDEVELRFRVTGAFTTEAVGNVRVMPEGQPAEDYILTYEKPDDTAGIFYTKLPASSLPFTFRAKLRDGRSRHEHQVRFEPRPVVQELNAWLVLPSYVDPEGKRRYDRFQPQAEVTALADCGVRIQMTASKPLKSGKVLVLGREGSGPEKVVLEVPLEVVAMTEAAPASYTAYWNLPTKATGYRIEVEDANGFRNSHPPRRGISILPDDPPRVSLLAEVLKDPREPGPLEDYDVSGMPLVTGGQVQIGYSARSPLGLARAIIQYRVNDGDWTALPLARTVADESKL